MRNRKSILNQFSKSLFTVAFLLVFGSTSFSQEIWSLQKCIEHARENSLSLKQARYGIEMAALNDQQNRQARLPNLNGSAVGGFQFGRTIDPTTNSFNNERITFNSYALNANMVVFNGRAISNTIKQGEYDLKASQADAEFTFNTLALNIANAYLSILMAEEQLENALKRRTLSEEQLEQTNQFIRAGTLPENDRLEVLAQVARDEQTIVQAQNLIDINYLNLKEFMQLDPNTEIAIERPSVVVPNDANPDGYTFGEVYGTAINTQPQVLRDELNLKSAEVQVDIARAAMLPQLVLFGGLDTRWSSASKDFVTSEPTGEVDEQEIFIDNQSVIIGFPEFNPIFENIPFRTQLDRNFGQSVGLSLNVPIYNNGRNSINAERAEVGILTAKLQSDLTKQQLKVDVQNAIAGARAAERSMRAAQSSVEATLAAFQNAEKQFELGAINTFQYTTARNNLDMAEIELTVAKYDYLFRLKIIDFYLGKELRLD